MLRIAEAIATKRKSQSSSDRRKPRSGRLADTRQHGGHSASGIRQAILRPLVGMDKQEIIDQARRIGTFDISSIPDQDCCQLFVPKHPATKARFSDVEADEAKLDVNELLRYGVENSIEEEFTFPPQTA